MWSHEFWYDCVLPWVTPAGSLLAVFIAARALAHNRWIRGRESARDRMAQAAMVSAWLDIDNFEAIAPVRIGRVVVRVQNASPALIYGCRIALIGALWYHDCGTLAPNSTAQVFVPEDVVKEMDLKKTMGREPVLVGFRDAANVTWRRGRDGTLAEDPVREGAWLFW